MKHFRNMNGGEIRGFLADGGAVDARDAFGETPLHGAVLLDDPALVRALLAAGADPNEGDQKKRTPLRLAAFESGPEVLRALLEAGGRPDERDTDGLVALHYAARDGRIENLRLLLAAGADTEIRDDLGVTPLHIATLNGRVGSVQTLLHGGADLNARTRSGGETALHWAMTIKDLEGAGEAVARVLLEAGADPKVRNSLEETPAHWAAQIRGDDGRMAMLLKAGADPDARNKWKATPLHEAAAEHNAEVVRFLLEAGADPDALDDEQKKPSAWANQRIGRADEVAGLLEAASRKRIAAGLPKPAPEGIAG